jgi:hypothetical protein
MIIFTSWFNANLAPEITIGYLESLIFNNGFHGSVQFGSVPDHRISYGSVRFRVLRFGSVPVHEETEQTDSC